MNRFKSKYWLHSEKKKKNRRVCPIFEKNKFFSHDSVKVPGTEWRKGKVKEAEQRQCFFELPFTHPEANETLT